MIAHSRSAKVFETLVVEKLLYVLCKVFGKFVDSAIGEITVIITNNAK